MKNVVSICVLLLSLAAAASAATRGECMGQCVMCGDDPVCGTIFENCVNMCMRQQGPAVRVRPLKFAAIAVSNSTLRVGYSWDYDTLKEAQEMALDLCTKSSKTSDCKLAVSARSDVCIAVAISGPGVAWGGAWGENADLAHRYALEGCRKEGGTQCFIKQTVCPDG